MTGKKNASLHDVVEFIDDYCKIDEVKDFDGAQNGLQFENSGRVGRVATAVDAGLCEIELAAHLGADMLIVHHGMFWTPPIPVTGPNYRKVKALIDADIALYSVHLPLDAHREVGHNVLIAKALGLKLCGGCYGYEGNDIGVVANAPKGGRETLERKLAELFPETFKAIRFGSETPQKVAICAGSPGDRAIEMLPKLGIDTLVCGELRQRHFTSAQELKLNLYPCGHYATERFGVMALGELVAKKFNLQCDFIEMPNFL